MSVIASGIAMAAYICPEFGPTPVHEIAAEGIPCADMDREKPVHCVESQAGAKPALEHLAAAPLLTSVVASTVMPAPAPAIPLVLGARQGTLPLQPGTDPPYLQTLRLRI